MGTIRNRFKSTLVSQKNGVQVHTLPSVIMMEVQLSNNMVVTLNSYLNKLLKDKERTSHADRLVGQIHQGEQLKMNENDKELQDFGQLICQMGADYINNFGQITGSTMKPKTVNIDELWSVHSYEGDYNPIHDHGTKTIMGISVTCWTKVPKQIGQKGEVSHNKEYTLYGDSGDCDGFLAFTYGRNEILNVDRLRPPQSATIQPKVGRLLMFPSWMQHMVYPFFGEGERRTVAANLNCWDMKE
tara:strand:- start:265 stop:993 length:729 start_codon:yes stop_codon:yes gene_type:complete